MKKGKKIITILLTIGVLIYVISAVYILISNATNTYIVKQGTITEEDHGIGYIVRDEKVIKGENYTNGIYAIASEGQRVAVGESIFRYYSDSEKEIKNKISELNYKIQELLIQEKNIPPSADIKSIEKQIEEKIQSLNKLTNYQEIIENKKNIDNLITKKINFIGNITDNKEIKALVKERETYEEQLKNGSEYQKALMPGIVSYRVDGLEEKLTTNNFDEMTEKYLNDLELQTGNIILLSGESGKVIDNFKCYMVVTLNSKYSKEAKVGDNVKLRISNNEEYNAKIFQINEETGKKTIIFEIKNMTEDFINHRKILVDVIWANETGLKVPKQALICEDGLYYVIRNKIGVQSKILVKIKMQNDKFAIIAPYENDELKELGYNSTETKNYRQISNYDEIILND